MDEKLAKSNLTFENAVGELIKLDCYGVGRKPDWEKRLRAICDNFGRPYEEGLRLLGQKLAEINKNLDLD